MTVAFKYDDFEDWIQLIGLEGDGKEMVNETIEENANKTIPFYTMAVIIALQLFLQRFLEIST